MLLIILVSLCALLVVTSKVLQHYDNPYKLIYIIGLKGAGKTTFMVRGMLRDIKRGKTVYTNIPHVYIPGVRVFDSKLLSTMVPPPESVMYIDEAGLVWDNRKFASFSDGLTAFFALQRQYRLTVYMNSQSLDVDKKIRDRIDKILVMSNFFSCLGIIRNVRTKIVAYPGTAQAEGHIGMDMEIAGLSGIHFIWLPKYRKYFKSFAPPSRPDIEYSLPYEGSLPVSFVRRSFRFFCNSFVTICNRIKVSFSRKK